MPQSLADVLVHIVFSSKNRTPYLNTPETRGIMTGYLVGTLANLDCPSLQVGVVADHVHLLCRLSRTITVAKLVEQLKTSSSKRIKQETNVAGDFHWQAGYGAFSVSRSNAESVIEYVANQEEHHRRRTFQEEFRLLLERHGLEWDERHAWD